MSRVLIITEGRSAWNMSFHRSRTGRLRVTLDSPILNQIHSAMIAKRELDRGNEVILVPFVDKLVSTREYTFPRTFIKNMEYLPSNSKIEDLVTLYSGHSMEIFEDWVSNLIINVGPSHIMSHLLSSSGDKGVSANLKSQLISESQEIFLGFKEDLVSNYDGKFKKTVNNMHMLAPMPMSAFDIEMGRELILLTLSQMGGANRKNLDLSYEVFPTRGINSKDSVMHAIEPIFRYYDSRSAVAKVMSLFSEILPVNEQKTIPKYGLPIYFDVDGYYNSSTRTYIDKGSVVRIQPKSRIIPNLSKGYKISSEAFMEVLSYKTLVSVKYPLIIADYIVRMYEKMSVRKSFNSAEEINKLVRYRIKDNYSLSDFITDLTADTRVRGKIDRIYFVEGDLGGVNMGTGGLVEVVFKMMAENISAEYLRVISKEREFFEGQLSEGGYLSLIRLMLNLEKKGNHTLYVNKDEEVISSTISDLIA